jgi:outer membrane protein
MVNKSDLMKRGRLTCKLLNVILSITGICSIVFSASAQVKELVRDQNKKGTLYTLTDCYSLASDRNIALRQAQNNINANKIDRKTAQFSLVPSLSYDVGHSFSFGKNIDPVTNTFVNETFSGGYTSMSLQLQVFSGFSRINTIKQSAYLIRAAEYAKKSAELELLTNVTLTYARLLLDKEQLMAQRNNIESTTKQLEVVNEKIKVGRVSRYEYYTFNARLNTEQADMVTIQNDSLTALQNLKQLLNLSYSEELEIAPIDPNMISMISFKNISAADLIEEILPIHPAIKQAEMNVEASRLGEKMAKGTFWPSISVGGNLVSNYNIGEENENGGKIPLDRQLNDNLGQNVSIGLTVPIFSQLQNANKVKKEKINTFNAQLAVQEAKNTVVTNTLQVVNDFNGAKQKYSAILSAWQQNKLSYNLYEEKYRLGQISSVELLAARDILNASTSKYLQAKLQLFFQFQLLELLRSY